MKTNILLMGPISPPYTGQSVAFTTIVEHYRNNPELCVHEIDLSNKNGILSGIILCLKISSVFLFNKIDIVYYTCSRSFLGSIRDVVMLSWAKIFHITVVNHLHGGDFKNFYVNSSGIYKKILNWCYKGVATSIVLLEGMKDLFNDFPNMNIEVIPNSYAASLDKFPQKKHRNNDTIKLLYLSNIMESKGILNLLDGADSFLRKNNKCKLIIAGTFISDYITSEQGIKRKFEKKYNELKKRYNDQIDYIGVVKGREKDELLWESDIFILPTFHKTEAFPISILEALRSGNYIVSTNHNYIPDIINQNNGELVKPNSVESLSEAIHKVINDKDRLEKVQNHNIDYAIENYSESKYIKNVTRVINENLSDNSYI